MPVLIKYLQFITFHKAILIIFLVIISRSQAERVWTMRETEAGLLFAGEINHQILKKAIFSLPRISDL